MIDYFIVCHDQDIILKAIEENKFFQLPDYRFLFVGNRSTNLIEHIPNVIVCNKLKENIENYPKLCSFTAWYAVSKNGLSQNNYSCLLEYDVEPAQNLHQKNLEKLNDSNICAYFREPINNEMFSKSTPWLDIFFEKYIVDTSKIYKEKFWYCTTNFVIQNKLLSIFSDWFYNICEMFKNDDLGAYMHERLINIFCIMNNYNIVYIPNVLKHFQLRSHNISDIYMLSKEHNTSIDTLYLEHLEKSINKKN
jgi:hypothetical protein